MVLCVFHKITVLFRSSFATRFVATSLAKKEPKNATVAGSFVVWGVKRTWFGGGRGEDHSPKRTKKCQKIFFLQCFLVLHKSLKGASTQHLKRPSWELFGALGPQKMHFTCIFTVFFCLQEEKPAFLHGFGAMREQPGTQGEIKNSILPAFLQGFCILGERVKG